MEEIRWKSDKERLQREHDAITKPELAMREAAKKLAEAKKKHNGYYSLAKKEESNE